MARNRQSSDNEYPKELIGQAVVDLRIVFAAYQRSEESREITLLQLYNIVLLIFPDGDKPSAEDLAEMCGISKTHASWHSQIDFKQFVRFFINHMDTSSFPAVSRDIFRAMDCDDSGEITAEELEESLTSMGMQINEDEALAMTSIADTSRDGLISYAQFKQICKRINHHLAKEVSKKPEVAPDSAKRTSSVWQKGLTSIPSFGFRSGPSAQTETAREPRDRILSMSKSLRKLFQDK